MALTKRALVSIVLLLACSLTSACGPPLVSTVAVFLDGGAPGVVLQPCEKDRVHGVWVQEWVQPAGSDQVAGYEWKVSDVLPGHPVTTVQLLTTPSGWVLDTMPDDLLRRFRDDATYTVGADTKHGDVQDRWIEFTLDDLSTLGEGQVWAARDAYDDERAMTRAEFTKAAAASC